MTAIKPPAGRGRPRSLPIGTTPSDRAAMSVRALKASGGHSMHLQLNASAWRALQALAPHRKRGHFIEGLILAAQRAKATDAGD